jgi:membrane protease YdiL (CAAX protease family)
MVGGSVMTTGRRERLCWAVFVVVALLSLDLLDSAWYGIVVPVAAGVLALVLHGGGQPRRRWQSLTVDRQDLAVVLGLYLAIVALFRVAFVGFGVGRVAGLFLSFAAGLLLGVVGPIWYTVWRRHRSMASLGLGGPWHTAVVFGLLLAAVQFWLTLWRRPLPADAEGWLPLLVMSLTVGAFETVFFRGFAQRRLEAAFGQPIGIAAAATLYALYHVGYGMGAAELVFLFGLGVVYALAFAVAGHAVVLWPLLTPLGAFYNSLRSGDIDLPWASIAGFVDVLAVMAVAVWLGRRHQRRSRGAPCPDNPPRGSRRPKPMPARHRDDRAVQGSPVPGMVTARVPSSIVHDHSDEAPA